MKKNPSKMTTLEEQLFAKARDYVERRLSLAELYEWTMDQEQTLDDGSTLRIHAAGPHPHMSALYLFAMDRPDRVLDHPGLGATARLVELRFEGRDHLRWRTRIERWLGRADAVGDVALRFVSGSLAGIAVTPVFAVPGGAGWAELAAGSIELVAG